MTKEGSQRIDRRRFIKRMAALTATMTFGVGTWRMGAWWDQPHALGYYLMSDHEVLISDAIAEALFPGERGALYTVPSAPQVGVTRFVDELLATMLDDTTANAVRVLMHAIDEAAILGGSGGMGRFHTRPLGERIALLKAWDSSSMAARRSAFSALKVFYAMGYCEHPDVLQAISIEYTCEGAATSELVAV